MNKLKYPHLFLFTYHLKDNPSETGYIFFPEDGEKELTVNDKMIVEGFSKRFSLENGEGNLFCCAAASTGSQEPQPLSCFKEFANTINSKFTPTANLHKTWMLVGHLPEGTAQENADTVAKDAYESFSPEKWPSNPQVGEFMGAKIFELWKSDQNWENLAAEENSRIVIVIFPDKTNLEKINNFYEDWVNLFYYRNKILWAYSNTLQVTKKLNFPDKFFPTESNLVDSKALSPDIKDVTDENLENLKISLHKSMVAVNTSVSYLETLEFQRQTIKTNLHNYQKRLKTIEIKARKQEEKLSTKLDCFRYFSEIAQHKYLAQIDKDNTLIASSVRLREKWIDTVRGIVEIKQIQSNRNIERNIAIAGFAIGTASAAASCISPFIETITQRPLKKVESKEILIPSNAWFNFWVAFWISFAVGIVFGFVSWGAWAFFTRRLRPNPPTK